MCCTQATTKGLRGTGELNFYLLLEKFPETGMFFQGLCRAESMRMKKRELITFVTLPLLTHSPGSDLA